VCSNFISIVELLLQNRANPDIQNNTLENSFHLASYSFCANLYIVKLLVKYSKKGIKEKNASGNLPIHIAVTNRNTSLVDFMLQQGIDIDAEDNEGNSLLLSALQSNNISMAMYLIEKGSWIEKMERKCSWRPLHYVALRSELELAKILVARGAIVNSSTDEGQTPLLISCLSEVEDKTAAKVVLFLLKSGSNPSKNDVLGYAPIHRAAERGSLLLLTLLLQFGADVNARTGQGETAFYFAYQGKHLSCVHTILTAPNFDPEVGSVDAVRPLHLIAQAPGDDHELMKMFIVRGANVNARSADGDTPLSLAVKYENKKIEAMLEKIGAKG